MILGVTGTLELVIPLGARLGHPIWRRALKAAGVPDATADDVVRRISESYVGWQENSFPGLLGNVAAGNWIANSASTWAVPTVSSTPPAPVRSVPFEELALPQRACRPTLWTW